MATARPVRILHVDDEREFAALVKLFLERERETFEVVSETDPEEILPHLETGAVDCIVSDYEMPDMDGLELLETVREEYPDLPFILFTGNGTEAVASEAISAGVTDYLQKDGGGDQFAVLANRIENAVQQYESERKFETLIDNLPGVVYRARRDPDWSMEFVGGEVSSLFGYSVRELETNEVSLGSDIIHPEDRDHVWQSIQDALDRDRSFELTYRIITEEGTQKWVWERGQQVSVSERSGGVLEGFITDITERKRAETELRQERERFSTLFENFPEPTLSYRYEGGEPLVQSVNEAFKQVFGYDRHEAVGAHVDDLIVPPEHMAEARKIDERVETGELLDIEVQRRTATGLRHFIFRNIPVTDSEIVDGYAVYTDVHEQKAYEQTLERYSETLETLHQTTQTLLGANDVDEAAEIAIASITDVLEFDIAGLWLADEAKETLEPVELTETGDELFVDPPVYSAESESLSWKAFHTNTTRLIDDMHEHEARVNPDTPIHSELIVPLGEHGLLNVGSTDVAEFSETDLTLVELWADTVTMVFSRLEWERQLRSREDEMARERDRLDEFVGVVSHDLRNPLNVASLRLDLARQECDSGHLSDVEQALDRMEQLIEDLLVIARKGDAVGETVPVRLSEVVSQCWEVIETSDATLECTTSHTISADENRLSEVFENLFRNAVEHGGCDVTIRVGNLPDGNGFYVADDGTGISADERDQIFESGYSTTENGTGFGLAIVQQIVDAHGWDVCVTESETGGTRFEISDVDLE